MDFVYNISKKFTKGRQSHDDHERLRTQEHTQTTHMTYTSPRSLFLISSFLSSTRYPPSGWILIFLYGAGKGLGGNTSILHVYDHSTAQPYLFLA